MADPGQSDLFLLILGTSFVGGFPNLEHESVPIYEVVLLTGFSRSFV